VQDQALDLSDLSEADYEQFVQLQQQVANAGLRRRRNGEYGRGENTRAENGLGPAIHLTIPHLAPDWSDRHRFAPEWFIFGQP
jgi:hypothetical protein